MRKDIADLFASEGQAVLKTLNDLRSRATDALELAIDGIPDVPSKRKKLRYVRESVLPLLLRLPKESERLAALDDIAVSTKLKPAVLKRALQEEAHRLEAEQFVEPRTENESETAVSAVPEAECAPLLEPGVLERYVKDAARAHGVLGDEESMKVLSLVAFGAQLELLPNGKPLGASLMLIAEAGRGKNYITDAAIGLMPTDWCLAFESASAASMYYQVENDPEFLKHRFVYPNEAEATDALVEFLRPMLSAGKAVRLTVNNTGPNGANVAQELEVRGPITTVIPTVRNKLDAQLQTRLLVAELEDYEGRVREHSRAFSRLLLPDFAARDATEAVSRWRAALRSLVDVRRVVFPLDRDEFALDNDGIAHGARLWANLLGLMCAHAWLEQRNRKIVELSTGERTIAATPDDYEAAFRLFEATSQRTVVNLSDTHRKILDALHELAESDPDAEGFSQRVIAEEAGISQPAVAKHKAFLVMSAKLIRETDHGLKLVNGAEPSWWDSEGLMRGFPSPEKVRAWYEEGVQLDRLTPHNTRNLRNSRGHRDRHGSSEKPRTHDDSVNGGSRLDDPETEGAHDQDHGPTTHSLASENGSGRSNAGKKDEAITAITAITGDAERNAKNVPLLTAEDALAEMNKANSGPAKTAAVYGGGQTHFEYLVKAVLRAKGLATDGWERHAPVVESAFERWKEEQ